jgi:hypothetical protein
MKKMGNEPNVVSLISLTGLFKKLNGYDGFSFRNEQLTASYKRHLTRHESGNHQRCFDAAK